jgi:hypothetical protein
MASPPSNVEPSELFLKLLERPKPSAVYPFPRTENGKPVFDVRVFVLNEQELGECKDAVRRWGQEHLKGGVGVIAEMDKDILGDRLAKEVLSRSVHHDIAIPGTDDMPDGPRYKRLFRGADDIDKLTSTEMALLYGAYLSTQVAFGPVDHSFESQQEVSEWVRRLQEGGGRFLLGLLQSHQLVALATSLAKRVHDTCTILQTSPRESWPTSLESLLETWQAGTVSSTEPVAESTDSRSEPASEPKLITPEMAMAAARQVRNLSKG